MVEFNKVEDKTPDDVVSLVMMMMTPVAQSENISKDFLTVPYS